MEKKLWLIGAGSIAQEYAKVLKGLNTDFLVVGRGEASAKSFTEKTNIPAIVGGIDSFLSTKPDLPDAVIVAVNILELKNTALKLIQYGVTKILLEKPGCCSPNEIDEICNCADKTKSEVFVAYNRRFYSSTLKAQQIINKDGGVTSFNFEFTEWAHVIEKLQLPDVVLNNNFFTNSTHVVDLAFYLGGEPAQMSCFTAGELSWHKPCIFSGAGISNKGALFSYQANWNAPGRWVVEILTKKHRLYFKPMETLQIQNIGSVAVNPVEIDDSLDKQYKPGFYKETEAFLLGNYANLCSIEQQKEHINKIYLEILNG